MKLVRKAVIVRFIPLKEAELKKNTMVGILSNNGLEPQPHCLTISVPF